MVLLVFVLAGFINAQRYSLPNVEQYLLLDFEAAQDALNEEVFNNPGEAIPMLRRARFYQLTGREASAKRDIEKASQLNPYAADLMGFNGPSGILKLIKPSSDSLLNQLSMTRRMEYYHKLLDQPYLGPYLNATELDYLEQSIAAIEQREFNYALNLLNKLTEQYPESVLGHDLKGLVLTELKYYEDAYLALQRAVKMEPRYPIVWYNKGKLAIREGDYTLANSYFERAISLQHDLTKAYFDMALLKLRNGEPEAALEDYNKIIRLKGDQYTEALINRAVTKKMTGNINGALEDINDVLEQESDNALFYKLRGNLHLTFGYPKKALEDYSKAIFYDKDFAEAYYNRALVNLSLRNNLAACEDFKESARLGFNEAKEKEGYFCPPPFSF